MAIRGQRFELDLDDDEGQFTARPLQEQPPSSGLLIGEIKERDPAAAPSAPKFKSTTTATGFPAHRKRSQQPLSRFKQAQQQTGKERDGPRDAATLAQYGVRGPSDQAIAHHVTKKYGISEEDVEKKQIDQENKEKLASMSSEEIEEARRELLANLNPTLLERFLKKANVDDDDQNDTVERDGPHSQPSKPLEDSQINSKHSPTKPSDSASPITSSTTKSVSFSLPSSQNKQSHQTQPSTTTIRPDDAEPTLPVQPPSSIHFPRSPESYVSLDPSSPNFLTDLQRHYFPSLPSDPSASSTSDPLSWLTSPIPTSPYSTPTSTSALPISSLRFSFTAQLLPPKISFEIPVTEGLHHHGHDPESAGYTIPELALLGRSTVPGQKCISFMVLGRLLYRLGIGEFGTLTPGDGKSILVEGLWECIERERVVEVMMVEAGDSFTSSTAEKPTDQPRPKGHGNRHQSVKAYATEALWLWRKGLEDGRGGTAGMERGIALSPAGEGGNGTG